MTPAGDTWATGWTFTAPGSSSISSLDLWRFARSGDAAPIEYSVYTDAGARVLEHAPASDEWEFGSRAFRDDEAIHGDGSSRQERLNPLRVPAMGGLLPQ